MQSSMLRSSTRLAAVQVSQRPQKCSISKSARLVVRATGSQQPAEPKSVAEKLALPAAAVLGAALLFAATPDVAEAARSGGRVGGSSGFKNRAASPAPQGSSPTVVNNYTTVAPPVVGGYGFGLPFFPGFGIGYGFGIPVFGGFSFIFNMMLLSLVLSVVWAVISNFTNSDNRQDNKKDDTW